MLRRFNIYLNSRPIRLNKTYKNLVILLAVVFFIVLIKLLFFSTNYEEIKLYYEMCDKYPNDLIKDIKEREANLTLSDIEAELQYLSLKVGGKWSPEKFLDDYVEKVAIIVPYRDRLKNLKSFARYMHQFLSDQSIHYGIYLIEPAKNLEFNRALLINIGFLEANKEEEWECFIFHDVDMLPENTQNIYTCDNQQPKQMAISISIYNYSNFNYFRTKYSGGVTAFTNEQFRAINGYSNLYYGWGAEDDDAYNRCMKVFNGMVRLIPEVGRYFANCHKREKENQDRGKLLRNSVARMDKEGLNTVKYNVLKIYKTTLFTLINVDY